MARAGDPIDVPWTLEASLKDTDVEETVDRLLHRPLAFQLLRPLQRRGRWVRPTHISVLSLLVGVSGGLTWIFGAWPVAGVVGAALVMLSVLLDCADGQLARLRGGGTHFGMMVDAMVDSVVGLFVWLGLSVASMHEGLPTWIHWSATLAVLVSTVIQLGLYDQYKERFEAGCHGRPATPPQAEPETAFERFAAAFRALAYGSVFESVQGATESVPVPGHVFRERFRRPMRILSWLGLGTHFGFFYVLAAVCAERPEWIVYGAFLGVVVVGNLVLAFGVASWKRAETSVAETAPDAVSV